MFCFAIAQDYPRRDVAAQNESVRQIRISYSDLQVNEQTVEVLTYLFKQFAHAKWSIGFNCPFKLWCVWVFILVNCKKWSFLFYIS